MFILIKQIKILYIGNDKKRKLCCSNFLLTSIVFSLHNGQIVIHHHFN